MTNDSILFSCFAIKLNVVDWVSANAMIGHEKVVLQMQFFHFTSCLMSIQIYVCVVISFIFVVVSVLLFNSKDFVEESSYKIDQFGGISGGGNLSALM